MCNCSPFWGPRAIPWLMNLEVHLLVSHQHSQFWSILACFVAYCSPFWCPGAFSMIDELQGAIMARSSTLAVLADPVPFCGINLTILESQAISTMNLWVRLRFCHQRSPFWLILARFLGYYSPFWGPRAFSMFDETHGTIMGRLSTLIFWLILACFVGYCSTFLGPEVFSMIDESRGAIIGRS